MKEIIKRYEEKFFEKYKIEDVKRRIKWGKILAISIIPLNLIISFLFLLVSLKFFTLGAESLKNMTLDDYLFSKKTFIVKQAFNYSLFSLACIFILFFLQIKLAILFKLDPINHYIEEIEKELSEKYSYYALLQILKEVEKEIEKRLEL